MTVSTTTSRNDYVAIAAQTIFPYTFKILYDSDLEIYIDGVLKTLSTHYTVSGAGGSGGNVTFLTPMVGGEGVAIIRNIPLTQDTDYVENDPFPAETHEAALDKLTMLVQQVDNRSLRSIRIPETDSTGTLTELPVNTARASKFLAFDTDGDVTVTGVAPTGTAIITSAWETVLDDTTLPASIETIRNALSAETSLASDDEVIVRDTSTTTGKTSTLTILAEALRALSAAKSGPTQAANYSLSAAVNANALTITLTGAVGTALSATNKAQFAFRSATATDGTTSVVDATADLTLTISSGSTLGTTSGAAARLWVVLFNDAGTLRLGLVNCSTATAIYPLADDSLASSTAEGGAGAADSAGVIYTVTAVTAKAMRVLGYLEITEATAGTWATAHTKLQLWQTGMKLPNDIVQSTRNTISTLVSGNTIFPADNTIPQNTEGMSILDATPITPTSTTNFIRVRANTFGADTVIGQIGLGLFRDSVANALAAVSMGHSAAGNYLAAGSIEYMEKAPSTSAITYKLRGGPEGLNTTYFGSGTATVLYGGVAMTSIVVEELMG